MKKVKVLEFGNGLMFGLFFDYCLTPEEIVRWINNHIDEFGDNLNDVYSCVAEYNKDGGVIEIYGEYDYEVIDIKEITVIQKSEL